MEARKAIWARAEVAWEDASAACYVAPATLEDTSPSGACIRPQTAIAVGSSLRVQWQREQFWGVTRNRRREGREFLLGIQRDPAGNPRKAGASAPPAAKPERPAPLEAMRSAMAARDPDASLGSAPGGHHGCGAKRTWRRRCLPAPG